jgi:glutathione S-transferase
MQLRSSLTSPFVRKVRILLIETGLDSKVELVATNPWAADSDLGHDNPLGKVPTLVTDAGEHLYDSAVICDYLDGLHAKPRLFPAEPQSRLVALRRQALADGILDAAVSRRIETAMRPEAMRWPWWIDRQKMTVGRGIDRLEAEADALSDLGTIDAIAVACVLGYLDFRFAAEDWRNTHPKLARWFARQEKRPSVAATVPHD